MKQHQAARHSPSPEAKEDILIKGLVGSGPPLPIPVQDSKDWESKNQNQDFDKLLGSKAAIEKDAVKKGNLETSQRVNQKKAPQDEDETKTSNPPESKSKVMDPNTNAKASAKANAKNSELRQRAIRKFMDSFEGEFGIPPEKMVEAMAQLRTQDLQAAPEKSAEAVLTQLEIEPQDELKAKSMYLGLLAQLKQIDASTDLPKSTEGLLSQLTVDRMQMSADKKSSMSQMVQSMNDKFKVKTGLENQTPQFNADPKVMDLLKQVLDPTQLQSETLSPEALQNLQMALESRAKTSGGLDPALALLKQKVNELTESDEGAGFDDLGIETMSFQSAPNALKTTSVKDGEKNLDNTDSQGQSFPNLLKISEDGEGGGQFSLGKAEKANRKSTQAGQEETFDLKSLQLGDIALAPNASDLDKAHASALKPFAGPAISEQNKTENLQQIMNQAQALIKKGGGEVNVEMRPEGLGSIQMKLQVLDGKVQLQMNTESKEAKKMIESSLHDLKQSLAAHQLSMDHVIVDVVAQSADSSKAQNDLQNQMQKFFDQQQRDGTRQFWQQFNDSFGNRQARDSYFDAQSMRSGMKRQELPGISETTGPKSARSTGRSGRSLNLVA